MKCKLTGESRARIMAAGLWGESNPLKFIPPKSVWRLGAEREPFRPETRFFTERAFRGGSKVAQNTVADSVKG